MRFLWKIPWAHDSLFVGCCGSGISFFSMLTVAFCSGSGVLAAFRLLLVLRDATGGEGVSFFALGNVAGNCFGDLRCVSFVTTGLSFFFLVAGGLPKKRKRLACLGMFN